MAPKIESRMTLKTRIGVGSLTENGMGSVTLPEGADLFCPQCGTEAADKGQCLVEVIPVSGKSKTGFVAKLLVDCRSCGYHGFDPGTNF